MQEDIKDDFDNWVDKWDKALKSDIFKSTPEIPSTAKQTSADSFFGFQHTNPTDNIDSSNAEYWKAIHSAADGVDSPVERLDESLNPVRAGTEGKDQDLNDQALGVNFSEDDVKKLGEMKVKLHELQSKIATMEDGEEYKSKVEAMIKKIDDLSDKMCGKK
jgi:hypothetical protein